MNNFILIHSTENEIAFITSSMLYSNSNLKITLTADSIKFDFHLATNRNTGNVEKDNKLLAVLQDLQTASEHNDLKVTWGRDDDIDSKTYFHFKGSVISGKNFSHTHLLNILEIIHNVLPLTKGNCVAISKVTQMPQQVIFDAIDLKTNATNDSSQLSRMMDELLTLKATLAAVQARLPISQTKGTPSAPPAPTVGHSINPTKQTIFR